MQGKKLSPMSGAPDSSLERRWPQCLDDLELRITVVSAKVGKITKKHPNPTIEPKLSASKTAALGSFNVTKHRGHRFGHGRQRHRRHLLGDEGDATSRIFLWRVPAGIRRVPA